MRSETDENGPLFESQLLSDLSEFVNRWTSYQFQAAHATRLKNDLDFTSNKILYLLGTRGPSRPSALAEQLATGRPNVSKIIKRMTEDGLLSIGDDPHDSRATIVSLTDKGFRQSHDVFHIGELMMTELTEGWSASELETFGRLVARVNVASAAYEARLTTPKDR